METSEGRVALGAVRREASTPPKSGQETGRKGHWESLEGQGQP
jgi:hypothetical protein